MPIKPELHKNGIYYARGTVVVWKGGQPRSIEVYRSTRTRDKDQASAICRQIENEVAERNITGREPSITFSEAATRYVRQGGDDRFLAKPRALLGHLRIDEITQQILDDEGAKTYPKSTATRRRQWHTPIIAVLASNGIDKRFKRPSGGQKRTIFLRPEQADRILNAMLGVRYPNPWAPALATFLFGQGSRVGETISIDGRDDISLDDGYAILRDTKNGHERMVTLCRRTKAALSTLPNLGQRGPLFLRYDGRPYEERENRGYRLRFWDSAVKRIGLDPAIYTPHTARHSWATWFYSQTKDVVRLKAEGGWESSEWERYVKLAAPSMGRTAARIGFDFRENEARSDSTEFLRKEAVR